VHLSSAVTLESDLTSTARDQQRRIVKSALDGHGYQESIH
jgi:hypothetical protein